jgi:hypothetical protein
MLPLGRKNARKCSECDITCHANCAHLVPDFCGMSMETANQLLRDLRDINRARGGKVVTANRPSPSTQTFHQYPVPSDSVVQMGNSVERLRLTGGPETASPMPEPYSRPQKVAPPQDRLVPDPRFLQQQPTQPAPYNVQNIPPAARPPPGARIPIPPGYPTEQLLFSQQQGRPVLPNAPEEYSSLNYQVN